MTTATLIAVAAFVLLVLYAWFDYRRICQRCAATDAHRDKGARGGFVPDEDWRWPPRGHLQ